jgi:hypothetical protein
MKLTNKKTTNYNCTTKTINQTTPAKTTNVLKKLHFFSTQTRLFTLVDAEFNRPEEEQKLEIELELKHTQARTYANITPIK